ncbi:MAG: RNA polymerase sigma factor [Burkholderiales bacterium]
MPRSAIFAMGKMSATLAAMSPADDTDEALMLRYRDGDAAGFEILYARHKGGVFRYLLRQCRTRAIAEELFQEVWLNLIKARASYAVRAQFSTYLYSVAHNRLIDHYRETGREVPKSYTQQTEDGDNMDNLTATDGNQPDALLSARQGAMAFLRLLEGLPEAQREAFLLHEEAAMSVEQIAAATSVSVETAKSRLRYALGKLRQGLQEVV